MHSVATRAVRPAERLELWGAFVREHIGWLEADTLGDEGFDGQLDVRPFPSYPGLASNQGLTANQGLASNQSLPSKLCRIRATRHRVMRTASLARRDDRGYVKIVAQLRGAACFEQNGRRAMLSPGDWGLYDTTQSYIVSNPETIDQIALLLPREQLIGLGIPLHEVAVQRFSGQSGAGRRAFDLLCAAFLDDARAGGITDWATPIAGAVLGTMLERRGIASEEALRETARARLFDFIAKNLRDPLLSPASIAEALGCSKRNLHKLFRREDETLNEFIWNERLECIRRDLADPKRAAHSITDIALDWGFNSSAHFSRSFRDRYGISPRIYRGLLQDSGMFWNRLTPTRSAGRIYI